MKAREGIGEYEEPKRNGVRVFYALKLYNLIKSSTCELRGDPRGELPPPPNQPRGDSRPPTDDPIRGESRPEGPNGPSVELLRERERELDLARSVRRSIASDTA